MIEPRETEHGKLR